MDNKKYNNETKPKEKHNELNNGKGLQIDINQINDSNIIKEEESLYITDENITYCSSPTSGLVSIKNVSNKNSIINIGSQISNISNTITFTVAIMKKEINCSEINAEISRNNTNIIKEIKEKQDNDNNNNLDNINNNASSCKDIMNDKDKKDKIKSFFKKKTKKLKDNKINQIITNKEINQNKNMNKNEIKKRKTLKSHRKNKKNINLEHSISSNYNSKEKKINKIREKTQKKTDPKEYNKFIHKKNEEKTHKNEKEIDEGRSPKIIILDFSSSENSEGNEEDSEKEHIKMNKLNEEEKNNDNHNHSVNHSVTHSINHNIFNVSFNKNEGNELSNKSKNEKDDDNYSLFSVTNKSITKEFQSEKHFCTPKSKNSCFLKTYQISQNKLDYHHSKNRKLSANYGTKCIIKTQSIVKIKKDKKKKDLNFFNICSSKYSNHNGDENHKNIINAKEIKEHIRKSNKKKTRTKNNKNNEINLKKDSNKSFHDGCATPQPNKKIRHFISHNYDKEKKLNMNFNNTNNNKPTEQSSLTNTPKKKGPKKPVYDSNRNLTNIKISSQAGENKDIHLEMNGKQETIINYTNQELVDDENEYMVECFKILLKLDKSKQPRCKNKVNFNFENSPTEKNKTKIALFDLDETLVHCTKEKKGLNGDSVNIKLPTNKVVNVGLNIRPKWKEALDLIKSHYHIVVYTASHQSYADAVLDYLDKENKYFQYRLYRNHCVQCDIDGIKFYVKDLDTLSEKYNLKDVVLIDNSVLSFAYHLNNGIPIVPYIEQKEDSQLLMLAYYLVSIANFDDLTEENKKHINIEHFILEVKNLENEEEEEDKSVDENKDNNKDNHDDNNKTLETKNETKNEDTTTTDNITKDGKSIIEFQKKDSNVSKKKEKKSNYKISEKALKIANDIKQNIADVYNKKL